jgi:23S rRNA pseudouridine1911/1915/1917 synthase
MNDFYGDADSELGIYDSKPVPIDYDPEEYGFDETDNIRIYEHHRIRVDPGQEIMRVDIFLTNRIRHISRSRIKNATLAGFVRINGTVVKASYKIKPYDEVSIILPYPPAPDLQPENIPLTVVYEDEQLIVINKQEGLVCHPGSGNYKGTLINALLYYFQNSNQFNHQDKESIRPGLVHRIDKDTSGLLVIAKNELAYNMLAKQFFERTTDRNYYALVWGNIKDDKGTIIGHVGRSAQDRKKFMVYEDGSNGKHAVTHYEVLQRFGICTLVKCKLETGRTHQIRVHFKYIGHTLFGDRFYGGNRILRGKPSKAFQRFIQECFEILPRQALHAKTLGFTHPTTNEYMHFDSELPEDFRNLLIRMSKFMKVDPLPELLPYINQNQ